MLCKATIQHKTGVLSALSAALLLAFGTPASAVNLKCDTTGCTPSPVAGAGYNSVSINGGSPLTLTDMTVTGLVPESTSLSSSVEVTNGAQLTINKAAITSRGMDISGLMAQGSQSKITANNVSITTHGEDADGIRVLDGGEVLFKNGSIHANGRTPVATVLLNDASVTFDTVTVTSNGKTFHSIFEEANTQQNIIIKGKSDFTKNNGTLLAVDRDVNGANGIVNLTLDGSEVFAVGDIDDSGNTLGSINVTISNGAHWAGIVIGGNTTLITNNQTYSAPQTFTQDYAAKNGAVLSFQNNAAFDKNLSIGHSVQAAFNGATTVADDLKAQQNSKLTFNDKLTVNKSVTAMNADLNFKNDVTVTQDVAGSGSHFAFSQGGNSTINGSLSLQDNSSISGGTVDKPIQINGNVTALSGAVLGGNLVSTGTLTLNGGWLSPGNSIGTQTYATAGALATGGYNVEINSQGQSDLITIQAGNIDISGMDLMVSEENGNGGIKLNHDYRILETQAGTIDGGGFKSQHYANPNSLIGIATSIGATNDFVTVRLGLDQQKTQTARKSFTPNQNATLDGVLSVYGQNPAATAAVLSNNPGAALNQLSGELHASTASALLANGNMTADVVSQRARNGSAQAAPVLWVDTRGVWQALDGNRNTAKVKNQTYGLFIGGDAAVGSGWRLGAALGATRSDIKVNDLNSKSKVNSYNATLYASNSWKAGSGALNLLAGLGYTRHNIDSKRSVSIGGAQTLKADYKADSAQLFTELGYVIAVGQASAVEPYLGLSYLNLKSKNFSETGGAAALKGSSQTDSMTTLTVGARAKTTAELGSTQATLFAGLGWRHASGDVEATRKLTFIQGNGSAYRVSGAPISKNAAVVELGVQAAIGKNSTLGLSYNGQFSGDITDNAGSVNLKVRF